MCRAVEAVKVENGELCWWHQCVELRFSGSMGQIGEDEGDCDDGEVGEWEDPFAAVIDEVAEFVVSIAVVDADLQVDDGGCAHDEEAEADECVDEGDVGDVGHDIAEHGLIRDGGQDPDETDAHAVGERGAIHPKDAP